MSPEARSFFDVAERKLKEAERAVAAEMYEIAAREAYLAALSATRAIIFEKTGTATKTHSGARSQLSKLVHEGLSFDNALIHFLTSGYEIKTDVDYGPVTPVQRSTADRAVENARAFLLAAKAVCG